MKTLLLAFLGLAIGFGMPTYAQQKDVVDPQITQRIIALWKAFDEAHMKLDAAAVATFFTRDAVFVSPDGTITGRQAIQKWYADLYQWYHHKNFVTKPDGNAYYWIGTAGNELWATGESNETGQGKNGEPIPIRTHWACIYVRDGDDWKIRVCAWNITSDSVIRAHKSLGR